VFFSDCKNTTFLRREKMSDSKKKTYLCTFFIYSPKSNVMGIIISLLLGALAGFLAGKLMRGGGFGLLGNILIGLLGGFIGGLIMHLLGINAGGGMVAQLAVAVLGAVVLLWIISLFKKK